MKFQLKKDRSWFCQLRSLLYVIHSYVQIRILASYVTLYIGQVKRIFSTRFKEHMRERTF